jgi:DNA-binding NarL/FixJ family response regulator
MKVLIVDDQESVRSALRCVLEQVENIQVVGESEDRESLISYLEATRPNLLMIDWEMFNGDAIAYLTNLRDRFPDLHILTMCSTCGMSHLTRNNETYTMISKSDSPRQLLKKVHAILMSVQESTGHDLR